MKVAAGRGWMALVVLAAVSAGCGSEGSHMPVPRGLSGARYVSTTGSDAHAGTRAKPWRTIQNALDTLKPSETAVVRAGVYRESLVMNRAGRATAPITVRAYPGETVVVQPAGNGDTDYPVRITSGAAYFRFQGFVVENAPLDTTVNVYIAAQDRPYPHDIEISRCEIRRSTGTGLLVEPNSRRVRVLGNVVHDNGIGTAHQHQGIYFQGRDGVIERNIVYGQPNGFGIQLRAGADRVLVASNTAVGNSLSGIVVENTATRVTVVNNISAYNGGSAINGYDSGEGSVLPGNVAHHNLGFGNESGDFVNADRPVIDFSGDSNVVANPRFVDRDAHDFHLRLGSPARGAGDRRYSRNIGAY